MEKMHKLETHCRVGDTVELTIEGLISDGRGLGRLPLQDGSVAVFVDEALPGQTVQAALTAVKPRLLEGRVTQVLVPSPHEREAPCVHADVCGGCPWQRLEAAEQLRWKSSILYETLRRVGKVQVAEEPILASPQEWNYRNKMAFVFGPGAGNASDTETNPAAGQGIQMALGQRGRRSHSVTDICACRLQDGPTMAVLETMRQLARTHGGVPGASWRHVVVRRPRAGGLGVEVIVGPQHRVRGEQIYDELRKSVPEITSFALTRRVTRTEVAQGEKTLFTTGEELEECLARPDGSSLRLRFNHASFLQVNTPATELLYAEVQRALAPEGHERLWDIYGGVGSIGLFMAPYVAEVCGVESAASAVTLARKNADLNQIASARYESGDAAALFAIGQLEKRFGPALRQGSDLMVVDPPRAGLDSRVIEGILRQKPARLVYVSCSPGTLARDVVLLAAGYELVRARPVDLFPQTPHVEAVALFVRR